jgi:hypothetical protein
MVEVRGKKVVEAIDRTPDGPDTTFIAQEELDRTKKGKVFLA